MILELALLNVIPGQEIDFEIAMRTAQPLIAASTGFHSIEVRRCIEIPSRYLLLVQWETLEDHTKGFRNSDDYLEWKRLLHPFYDPFPEVEHYAESFLLD
jgi:heme-degrading monooxygenase HmoA